MKKKHLQQFIPVWGIWYIMSLPGKATEPLWVKDGKNNKEVGGIAAFFISGLIQATSCIIIFGIIYRNA